MGRPKASVAGILSGVVLRRSPAIRLRARKLSSAPPSKPPRIPSAPSASRNSGSPGDRLAASPPVATCQASEIGDVRAFESGQRVRASVYSRLASETKPRHRWRQPSRMARPAGGAQDVADDGRQVGAWRADATRRRSVGGRCLAMIWCRRPLDSLGWRSSALA